MVDVVGVFGLIMFWNGFMMLFMWKMVLCLVFGNFVVYKFLEMLLLFIGVLCEIFEEVGMFNGVYNMVLGYGKEVGVLFVEYEDVIGVLFIGFFVIVCDIVI